MITLGLDIGTTTISSVVFKDNHPLTVRTIKNDATLHSPHYWEKIQDPVRISTLASTLVQELLLAFPDICGIGVTGQQHGILYLDSEGHPVSPLYTWQDERGNLPLSDTQSYASYLSEQTKQPLSTGLGTITHFYNLKNNLIPDSAVNFCTIPDFIAMILSKNTEPLLHPSNAASLGLFDIQQRCFQADLLLKNQMDPFLFPSLASSSCIGMYKNHIPVFTAIGDNQASFLGTVMEEKESMLINIGTGGQFSAYTSTYQVCDYLETRPFLNDDYLLVGSSLCGGRAYALLETFFRNTAELFSHTTISSCYDIMSELLNSQPEPSDLPFVTPLFQGSRIHPDARASITGLCTQNFTPIHLIYGFMYGIVDELYSMYTCYAQNTTSTLTLFGSGNGLRHNPTLCRILETRFKQPVILSSNNEEAACGAALFAKMQNSF